MQLKHLPYGNKACSLCDLYQTEDIFHVVIQCPGKQLLRNEMYTEIASCANADSVMKEYALDTMSILLENSLLVVDMKLLRNLGASQESTFVGYINMY